MKRFALLAATAVMALSLAACGDNAEKKVEGQANTEMDQSKSQLNNVNKDVNKELNDSSDAAKPATNEAAPTAPAVPATNEAAPEKPAQ